MCPFLTKNYSKMSVFLVKTLKIRWQLGALPQTSIASGGCVSPFAVALCNNKIWGARVEIIRLTFKYSSCQSRRTAKKFGGARVTTETDCLLITSNLCKTGRPRPNLFSNE